jgi:hypothetical protein
MGKGKKSTRSGKATLMRAVAMLAGIAFVSSALTASAAADTTTSTAPRTTAIAWADCVYGLESLPTPPLAAYALTSDGIVMRSFDNGRAESAVIGPKRFRAIAEGMDRTIFGPPPEPTPTPSPIPGSGGLVPIGHTIRSDTRRARFAVRHDGEWDDWSVYREYTKAEEAAVGAAYDAAFDRKLVWHPAPPRANPFAVCNWGAPRDAMTIPASPTTSKWGVAEIIVADCHHGLEAPGAPPLRAYRLMRSGNVARTTAEDGDSRTARRTENADLGFKNFAAFGARLEKSGFFQEQFTSVSVVVSDTRGKRLSALRDDRRTTWNSEQYSSSRNHSDIMVAILDKVNDPSLKWAPGPLDSNAFSICTQ